MNIYVKCKARYKKEKKRVSVKLNRRNGKFETGSFNCPAGNSSYCNHVSLNVSKK